MEKKIQFVRLISGEELIATHFNVDENTFGFEKAIQVVVTPPKAPNQPPGIGFSAWLPYTKAMEKVYINKNCVMLMVDPDDQLLNAYQKITGKVITPTKGFILPT